VFAQSLPSEVLLTLVQKERLEWIAGWPAIVRAGAAGASSFVKFFVVVSVVVAFGRIVVGFWSDSCCAAFSALGITLVAWTATLVAFVSRFGNFGFPFGRCRGSLWRRWEPLWRPTSLAIKIVPKSPKGGHRESKSKEVGRFVSRPISWISTHICTEVFQISEVKRAIPSRLEMTRAGVVWTSKSKKQAQAKQGISHTPLVSGGMLMDHQHADDGPSTR